MLWRKKKKRKKKDFLHLVLYLAIFHWVSSCHCDVRSDECITFFTFTMPSTILQSLMQTEVFSAYKKKPFPTSHQLFTLSLPFLVELHSFLGIKNCQKCMQYLRCRWIMTSNPDIIIFCSLSVLFLITQFLVWVLSDIKLMVDGLIWFPWRQDQTTVPEFIQQPCTPLSYQTTYQVTTTVQPLAHRRSKSA